MTSSLATPGARAAGAALAAAALFALLRYKWTGAVGVLDAVRATGRLPVSASALATRDAVANALYYARRIAPALGYGVVLGAAVRVALPERLLAASLDVDGTRGRIAAALGGAPLMLCSCCVTPVFTAVHERTRRLGPALTLMLASPGLNAAALTLTFLLFPARVAASRLIASALLVFALPPLLVARPRSSRREGAGARATRPRGGEAPPARLLGGLAALTGRSVVHLAAATLPLIAAGALASGVLASHLAPATPAAGLSPTAAIALAATIGTAVALPTFCELPLAMSVLAWGAPAGAATALLVAGPIVNLPSLFVLAREAGARTAAVTAVAVAFVAAAAGACAQWL